MSSYVNGPSMFGMSIALSALSILAVAGRFYIRKTYKQGLGADDWLMLPALLGTVGMAVTIVIGVEAHAIGYSTGNNELDAIDQQFVVASQTLFAVFLINILGLMFAKLSILFFYRRVFLTGNNKAFNYTTIVLTIFIICWAIAFFFATLFSCGTHFEANWGTFQEFVDYCYSSQVFNLVYVLTDLLQDLTLLILPVPLILRLRLSVTRRVAILLIFGIGALAVVSSLIRVIYFGYIYADVTGSLLNVDPILNNSIFMYWTMLEGGLAIIVASLPTFQVWFRKVTVDTVMKNVRGIFSVQSFSRGSRASAQQKSREATSSEASLQRRSLEMLPNKDIAVKSEITMEVTPNSHGGRGMEY